MDCSKCAWKNLETCRACKQEEKARKFVACKRCGATVRGAELKDGVCEVCNRYKLVVSGSN